MSSRGLVFIEGLRAQGMHGVLVDERSRLQPFIVDIEMRINTEECSYTDDLSKTVNYAPIAVEARRIVEEESYYLLEKLARRIADTILANDLVESVKVSVRKIQPPIVGVLGSVGVTLDTATDVPDAQA
jgi:dihydroneopterin aldolase